jgi:hypothetical protein
LERPGKPLRCALALGVFLGVALVGFRPLFFRWNRLPTYAQGDVPAMALADRNLNVWILGWVAHALATDPARLFDGNILHPAPDTLAGSENMLAHVPFTLPVFLATGNSAWVLKAMMLESIVLTAFAAFLVVLHHTGDTAAAIVAGVLLTLSPWRYEPSGVHAGVAAEPQYLGFQFLPLALLATALWFERGRGLAWAGIALAVALQALASFYLGYVSFAILPVYALALAWCATRPGGSHAPASLALRRLAGVATALLAAAVLVVPAALPYLRLRRSGVVPVYDIDFVARMSAPPWNYLAPAGLRLVGPVAALVTLGFGLFRLAQTFGLARRGPRPRRARTGEIAAWTMLVAGLVLAWGPYQELPGGGRLPLPFALLWRFVPGFSAMRGAGRFVVVLSLACALLAGYALAAARSLLGAARWPLAAALAGAALFLAARHPVPTESSGIGADAAPAYRFLAGRPPGEPLLELPAKAGEDDLAGLTIDSQYMLASTVHWQPLLNGYTAYEPPSRDVLAAIAQRLPAPDALDRLLALVDLRWVLVHGARLAPEQRDSFGARGSGLTEVLRDRDDVLYAVAHPRPERRPAELARTDAALSLDGTPRSPLAPTCRTGALRVDLPETGVRHRFAKARLSAHLENRSECDWPALGAGSAGLVMLEYAWLDGDRVVATGVPGRLGRDVPAGTAIDEPFFVLTPRPGTASRLRVVLRQQGQESPIALWEAAVEVSPPGAPSPGGGGPAAGPAA